MKQFYYFILLFFIVFNIKATAQDGWVFYKNLQQADNRIYVEMRHERVIGLGTQNIGVVVTNKTTDELRVKLEYSAHLVCGETITKTLNGIDGAFLKPGETTDTSSWFDRDNAFFEISLNMSSNCRNNKNNKKEVGKNEYSAINSVSYRLISIENISQKKRDEATKREKEEKDKKVASLITQGDNNLSKNNFDDALKNYESALEIDPQNNEAKNKINSAKQKQVSFLAEQKAKEEKEKKETEEKQKEKLAKEQQEKEAKQKQESESKPKEEEESSKTTSSYAKESANEEEEQKARHEQQLAEKAEAERKRKEAEEEAKRQRQAEYDQWKAEKNREQSVYEAEAVASTIGLMYILGGFIYDGMGNISNPDYVYKPYLKSKGQFFVSLDIGFSLSSHPLIFGSDYTTMVNGSYVNTKELQPVSAFTLNLEGSFKMGVASDYYNAYGFISPKAGISPIFNGSNVSPFNYGGHVSAGLKWVKLYAELGKGSRTFNWSSNDVEEGGSGKVKYNYSKLTYGLKFTTNPNENYVRDHIFIGLIKESVKTDNYIENYVFFNPHEARTQTTSDKIDGYTIHWKKDHNFDFYINAYPNYWYGGLIEGNSGSFNSEFTKDKTGLFLEIGFIRSFDWFISY